MPDAPVYPGMPGWVKISGLVAAILVLLIVIVVVTDIGGPHGPGRHLQSGDATGNLSTPPVAGDPTDNAPVGAPAEGGRQ